VVARYQFLNGFLLGFIIQTVSLGSTAIIAIHWGAENEESLDSPPISNQEHGFFYFVLFVLSQSWWLLFPAICIGIDEGLTGNRVQGLLEKNLSKSNRSNNEFLLSAPSQRELFLRGIRFHIGIVVGCFGVWSLIDLYFGASLDVFASLFASLLSCLGLCYGMVIVRDWLIAQDPTTATATATATATTRPHLVARHW